MYMQTYKVTLGYSPAKDIYAAKTRYVLADTKENAIKQARAMMHLPEGSPVLRLDIQ